MNTKEGGIDPPNTRDAIIHIDPSPVTDTYLARDSSPFRSQQHAVEDEAEDGIGYPKVAAYYDQSQTTAIYRRFGTVGNRLLLHRQAQLQALELELNLMDNSDAIDDPVKLRTTDLDEAEAASRNKLLAKLEKNYVEYSTLLDASKRLYQHDRPTEQDHRTVQSWFENYAPLCESDQSFLSFRDDLVSLKATPSTLPKVYNLPSFLTLRLRGERAWIDNVIEKFPKASNHRSLRYIWNRKGLREDSNLLEYQCTRRQTKWLSRTIVTLATLILLAPFWFLYYFTVQDARTTALAMGVLIIFTLLFSAAMSLFSRARVHEIFAASGAYCAVLVFFLNNVSTPLHSIRG